MIKSYQEGAEAEAEAKGTINFLLRLRKEELESVVMNTKRKNLVEFMITLLVPLIKGSALVIPHILNMIKASDIMKDQETVKIVLVDLEEDLMKEILTKTSNHSLI
jgi:competence protein ComGF